MNDKLYIEERVENIHSESNSVEANKEMKEILEKRARNLVSKIVWSHGREKQNKRRVRR